MRFRLGYVAMTLNLVDCSPSSTVTVTAFNKLQGEEARLYRLRKLARKNLENTLRILRYNKAYAIMVYRFTSKLIPLATHPLTRDWDYTADFRDQFREIGDFVRENNFRVSAHPDHYTLINSPSEQVLEDSLRDLDYHVRILEAMGLEEPCCKLVMHVGGLYGDKASSIARFMENYARLPGRIRDRLMLENDDKSYSAADVLGICRELKMPMVLDVHHHKCINGGDKLEGMLPEIFDTWRDGPLNPKIHFSSPKSQKDFRSHADNIDLGEFLAFIDIARETGRDFDIMLEAKNKDRALLVLADQLQEQPGFRRINQAEFEI